MAAAHTPVTSRAHEDDLVELVDPDGTPIGQAPRVPVHTTDTPLHRAFSSYLFNRAGQVLMTRRALGKATWPGVWTNACCGHPRPGEASADAVARRVPEELGVQVGEVEVVLPDFAYRAVDASGIVENELCPVFIGYLDRDDLVVDPDEVMDYRWMDWDRVVAGIEATPEVFSPWSVAQVPQVAEALARRQPPRPGGGGQVRATPRLEDTLALVEHRLAHEAATLADSWATHVEDGPVDVLAEDLPLMLADLLGAGGKRIRPIMCHWGFVACGGTTGTRAHADMLTVAAALEMLHAFALVHDDVMDDSDTRRGLPSAHVRGAADHLRAGASGAAADFGRNMAVLLGDLAHAHADRMVTGLPTVLREGWYELCLELIAGQRADLSRAAAGRTDLGQARHVALVKSGGYTVQRPLLLGAEAASSGAGDPARRRALEAYGRHVGEAFALRDDILGIWGDPEVTGKPAGEDLRDGKATVILAMARQRLEGPAARALDRVGSPEAHPGDVAKLQQAMVEAGVRDAVEEMITACHDRAMAELDTGLFDPAGVSGLRDVGQRICWRNR